jgi:hypothetical protein
MKHPVNVFWHFAVAVPFNLLIYSCSEKKKNTDQVYDSGTKSNVKEMFNFVGLSLLKRLHCGLFFPISHIGT